MHLCTALCSHLSPIAHTHSTSSAIHFAFRGAKSAWRHVVDSTHKFRTRGSGATTTVALEPDAEGSIRTTTPFRSRRRTLIRTRSSSGSNSLCKHQEKALKMVPMAHLDSIPSLLLLFVNQCEVKHNPPSSRRILSIHT